MKKNTRRGHPHSLTALAMGITSCLLAGVPFAQAADGSWASPATGNWSTSGNWTGGTIADGPDSTASFLNDITSDVTIHLDTARTNGNLVFGDADTSTPANWILDNNGTVGNILTLSGANRTITVNALGATNFARITAVMTGTNLTETGSGMLALNSASTFTNLLINGGTVRYDGGAGSLGANNTNSTITLQNATLIRNNTVNSINSGLNVIGNSTFDCSTNGLDRIANAGNWNGFFTGNGTLNLIIGPGSGVTLTTGGNNAWNSNMWANFAGTVLMSGGGNLRFDINNATTAIFGGKLATFDLGTGTNTMAERAAAAVAQHTTFIGALKGGPGTLISANSKAGDTNTIQIGDAGITTSYEGRINNPTSAGVATALTKSGAASLTLNGTNNYTGITTVQNGTLVLSLTGSISNSPAIILGNTGVFDVSAYGGWTNNVNQGFSGSGLVQGSVAITSGIVSPGVGTNIAKLRFANNLTLVGTVVDKIGYSTNDSVAVGGDLDVSGGITVQLSPPVGAALLPNGVYPLFSWGGNLTGGVNNLTLSLAAQSAGATFVLTTNVSKQIVLTVAGNSANNLFWKGNGSGNVWDHATPNWLNGAAAASFTELDNAIFDDSGDASSPVAITDVVTPSTLVVNNTNKNYAFTSQGGRITGITGLTKNGPGSLSILEDNDFSGSVVINAGTVQIGDNANNSTVGSLGTGSLQNNGALVYNRSDDITLASPLLGIGVLVQNSTNTLTSASGTMILTADSANYGGSIVVSNGTLQLGDGSSAHGTLSTVAVTTVTNYSVVHYLYNNNATIQNAFAGNGRVTFESSSGIRTFTFNNVATNYYSPGFSGQMFIISGVSLHANTGNFGYNFGNGSSVDIADGAQAWIDSLATTAVTSNYNQAWTIRGVGLSSDPTPTVAGSPGLGAMRIFNNTLTGPITLASNARIGGNSSGSTIQGQISDGGNGYQLEVATSNPSLDAFILTLSPASGPNAYGSTLITSGTVQAGNTNAITNAVIMTGAARLRLNGNNLNISSLSGGTPFVGAAVTNCQVFNFSTTNPATLSFGNDGNSQQFDGIFGDGSSQPLSLIKLGGGTQTLTGDSTNTGTVTVGAGILSLSPGAGGSGSFSNASQFAISSGAFLNVNGRGDQTLTLRSGQTLSGSGTLSGNVASLAGSTVSPGTGVGTLTVQGNVNLGGTLLMELNRTNTPINCDRLVSSGGTITYGGSLFITNIGPALHVNDTFTLFPGGLSGLNPIVIATNDANNMSYTFQNDLAALGSIKVLTAVTSVNRSRTNINFALAGDGHSLALSWPADHLGWTLQTNAVSVAATNSWFAYPGSATTNSVTIPILAGKTNVFFRLIAP